MTRLVPDHAKVIHSADNAPPEYMLPDAIDHHARGQRIIGTRNDFGKLTPAAAHRFQLQARAK